MSFDADLLREIEATRLRSLVDGDIGVAERVHADDYQLVTPSGRAMSKRDYLDAVASKELHYREFAATTPMAVWGDDRVAVLRYRARIAFHDDRGTPIECWHTDCYRNAEGQWQAVWSQATRISP
jgi:Domain of unknown function (DUF4440)